MPVNYTLEPDLPNTVRVTDDETGMSRLLHDPKKAAELKAQQPATSGAPQSAPWNGKTFEPQPNPSVMIQPSAPPPAPPARPGPNAMTPAPEMIPGSPAPAPSPAPTAPGSTQLTKAELTPGFAGQPYDLEAENQRHEGLVDRKLQMQGQSEQVQALLNEQQIRMGQQAQEDQERQRDEQAKATRYSKELEDTKRTMGDMSNLGAIGTIVLGLTALFVAKRGNNPGAALSRMNQSLESAIGRDIELQRHNKTSKINQLTRQLGDAQQAELAYRGSVRRLALERVGLQLKRVGEEGNLAELMRAAEAEVSTIDEAAKNASYAKPGTAKYEYTIPKPEKVGAGPFVPTDASSKQLKALLGPDFQKQYLAGMDSKVTSGQTPQTVQTALPAIRQMTDDEATLTSLARENGGHIPTKGVINIPGSLIGKMAQMGVKSGMQAEEARQLIQGYISQKARSYGGVITDSDREQAEREMGASGDGLLRAVSRMKTTLNNGVRQALATHFRGNAQHVLNIALSDYAANSGVPQASSVEPFDVHSGAPTPPAGPGSPPAPRPASDPVKTIRQKGLSRAASDALFGAEPTESPGSAL